MQLTSCAESSGAQPTLSQTMWSYPGPESFKLRGRNYLRDKKKVYSGHFSRMSMLFSLCAVTHTSGCRCTARQPAEHKSMPCLLIPRNT